MEHKLSAACPKCKTELIYVTAVPHRHSPDMHRTTFICYGCNQTRSYTLSAAMADGYAALCASLAG
jgi:RNase P subunit RPR2